MICNSSRKRFKTENLRDSTTSVNIDLIPISLASYALLCFPFSTFILIKHIILSISVFYNKGLMKLFNCVNDFVYFFSDTV